MTSQKEDGSITGFAGGEGDIDKNERVILDCEVLITADRRL